VGSVSVKWEEGKKQKKKKNERKQILLLAIENHAKVKIEGTER